MDSADLTKIQSQLSFSYVHAVTSRAGGVCSVTTMDEDKEGIDARLYFPLAKAKKNAYTEVTIQVQLKSTRKPLTITNGKISYRLPADQANKYSQRRSDSLFLLVLFHVPDDCEQWLSWSEDELVLRRCCYWTALKGLPPCDHQSCTVHIPTHNVFSVEQLTAIVEKVSQKKDIIYGQ